MEFLGFQLMDDTSMKDLLEDVDSANTKKQIKYAVGRLEMFEEFSGKKAPVSSAAELDTFLGKFYAILCRGHPVRTSQTSFCIWP